MIASYDYRRRIARLEMTQGEFRDTVEWLEEIAPTDLCTRQWRTQYDDLFPPTEEEDDDGDDQAA